MKIVIDRIEGATAVVELADGSFCNVPVSLFAPCREGDIFSIEKDDSSAKAQKKKIDALMDELFE